MGIEFRNKEEWFTFFDGNGNQIDRKTEIRFDPLTNESSRLVFDPGLNLTPPDYTELAEQTGGAKCPFCPENILKLTPVFPKEIAEEGRIQVGEAILFPNLFPYAKHNAVVAITKQHYVRLEEFTQEMIRDALLSAQLYIQRVMKSDPEAKYASINWNYLPSSGGSILHPHMHIVVSDHKMNYQSQTSACVVQYRNENGQDFYKDLYAMEKATGERWIGEVGNVAWMHAYAPKSHNDFIAVMPKIESIDDITDQDWLDYAKSVKGIFSTLNEQGFASFNMILSFASDSAGQSVHARLIPRLTIGLLGTSDINFFQALHQEPLSYKAPEDIAKLAREQFKNLGL